MKFKTLNFKKIGFKKIILAISILLVAAACNKKAANQAPVSTTPNASQNQNQSQTQNSSQAQTGMLSDWKTYTDAQYGFSFMYPPQFSVDPSASQHGVTDPSVVKWTELKNGQETISVVVLKNKFDPASLTSPDGYPPITKTSLDGQAAYQYPGPEDGPCSGMVLDTALGNQTLEIGWGACEMGNQQYVLTQENTDAILASFHFKQ